MDAEVAWQVTAPPRDGLRFFGIAANISLCVVLPAAAAWKLQFLWTMMREMLSLTPFPGKKSVWFWVLIASR